MLLKRLSVWIFAVGLVCQPVMYIDWAQAGSCIGDCRRDVKNCHNVEVEEFELAFGSDSECLVCDLEDLKLALTDECGNDYLACVDACFPDDES
jgi:hypothetical protein